MARAPRSVFVNVAASQTDYEILSAVPGKALRVLQVILVAGDEPTDVTFNTVDNTSTAISPLFANAANGGAVLPYTPIGWFQTRSGESLTVTTSSGSSVGILLAYQEY